MRKIKFTIAIMPIIIFVLFGCTPAPKTLPAPKINYTAEINFLPSHPSMKLKEFRKGEGGAFDFVFYTISGTEYNKFLTEYENILKQDGWTITDDKKPDGLSIKKNEHLASMALAKIENEIVLTVAAK
jgi:hypothetical protein